jgi:hypothetical protein
MVFTGRYGETIEIKGETVNDLLSRLDEKYPGFKEIFLAPSGCFNIKTTIHLIRHGEPAKNVLNPYLKLKEGDVLSFW